MTWAQIKLILYACVVVVLIFIGWNCSRKQYTTANLKSQVKAQTRAAEKTAESVKISTDTQKRVETESEDTRQRTQRAVEAVDARIEAEPAAPGPGDPDLLRIAREAHSRALSAHCRVQRTSDCANPAAAP